MPDVMASLESNELVIAYLGSHPWNPNVMLEVGYRLACKKPIVLLRDTPIEGQEPPPFDLTDHRVIELPKLESKAGKVSVAVDQLAKMIQLRAHGVDPSRALHPLATIRISVPKDETRPPCFVEVSPDAQRLFQLDRNKAEHSIEDMFDKMKALMLQRQTLSFFEEQLDLMEKITGEVMAGLDTFWQKARTPKASVPIVFDTHVYPEYIGRAYLPIILHHSYSKEAALLYLRVLYLDVTKVTRKPTGARPFTCQLFKPCGPLAARRAKPVDQPDHMGLLLPIELDDLSRQQQNLAKGLFQLIPLYERCDTSIMNLLLEQISRSGVSVCQGIDDLLSDEDLFQNLQPVIRQSIGGVICFFGSKEDGLVLTEEHVRSVDRWCGERRPLVAALLPGVEAPPSWWVESFSGRQVIRITNADDLSLVRQLADSVTRRHGAGRTHVASGAEP